MTQLTTRKILTAAGAVGLSLAAAACGSSSSTSASSGSTSSPAAAASTPAAATPSAAPAAAVLKIDHTSLGSVLANAHGFTVYWFAKDTATNSACSGACAAAWPPVIGMPQAASGIKLTGTLGEIKRTDGSLQAAYDGHPLYLFAGDSRPGQVNGNAVDGFGALWYAVKIGAPPTTTGSGSSGNSGGGSSGSGGGGW